MEITSINSDPLQDYKKEQTEKLKRQTNKKEKI